MGIKKIFLTILVLALLFNCAYSKEISLDEKIGQMILIGFDGTSAASIENSGLSKQIRDGRIGGIMALGKNIVNHEQFKHMIQKVKAIKTKYPLLIAVDQEGGKVARFSESKGFDVFPSAKNIATSKTTKEAAMIYAKMAKMINENEVNLNFGPVVDLNINPLSPAIGKMERSYGKKPETVIKYAQTFVDAHRENRILTCLKHFPGHGSASFDSHKGFTDISDTWSKTELIPYEDFIRTNDVDMIMSSHVFDSNVDDQYPASLSKMWIQGILRDNLGYDGVVITDDLQMGAIAKSFSMEEAIIAAINSGTDILLFSGYEKSTPSTIVASVKRAVKEGSISRDRIEESFDRIQILKKKIP